MALLRRGLRDRSPARLPPGRWAGDRAARLDGDNGSNPDRGRGFDHRIEIGVRQNRLQQGHRGARLAACGPLADHAGDDTLAVDLDHLELVFEPATNGHPALTRSDAEDAREVMALFAVDPNLSL